MKRTNAWLRQDDGHHQTDEGTTRRSNGQQAVTVEKILFKGKRQCHGSGTDILLHYPPSIYWPRSSRSMVGERSNMILEVALIKYHAYQKRLIMLNTAPSFHGSSDVMSSLAGARGFAVAHTTTVVHLGAYCPLRGDFKAHVPVFPFARSNISRISLGFQLSQNLSHTLNPPQNSSQTAPPDYASMLRHCSLHHYVKTRCSPTTSSRGFKRA